MSWVRELSTSGLLALLNSFEKQLDDLRKDLEELAKNRKNTYAEQFVVQMAYDWLHDYLVQFKFWYLDGELDRYPRVKAKLLELIDEMEDLTDWIHTTFMDLMNARLQPNP